MKLHRNIAEAVAAALRAIFDHAHHAESVVHKMLKAHTRWGARDRRLAAACVYDIVRWRLRMEAVASDSCPWSMLAVWCVKKDITLPTWREFEGIDAEEVRIAWRRPQPPHIAASMPLWMYKQGAEELGVRWAKELEALNKRAAVTLRVNTLKGAPSQVKKRLAHEHIAASLSPHTPYALALSQPRPLTRTEVFRQGYIEVQDIASQQVAPFLQVAPGMRVVDACAGAGGKTLHLAALMKNRGELIALDIDKGKLAELKRRAKRAGVAILKTVALEPSSSIDELTHTADRLLLDVPCSAIGVLRRHPDLKWRLQPAAMRALRTQQKTILEKYSKTVKPGGLMVYATCSIFPSENEAQIEAFLHGRQHAWKLIAQRTLWPSEGADGFYMAALKKID